MKYVTVVGGGIAGLVSSLLLAKKGYQVTLIEKEKTCGGLLRSFSNEDGVSFDLGTHILSQTLIQQLDQILFEDLEDTEWKIFDILKTGNYFEGNLFEKNQSINTSFLSEEIFLRGVMELLQTEPFDRLAENLKTYTEKQFGPTFSKYIFEPLMRKLQGRDLEELHPDAHRIFGYTRLIVANEHASRELKRSTFYDEKVSFVSYYEGVSPSKKYYPKNGQGIGKWIEILQQKAIQHGVKVMTGRMVSKILKSNNEVASIILDNEDSIKCDYVIWTLSPLGFLKASSVSIESKQPEFRNMSLHHFVFDKPFLTDNHYVYCNDPKLKSFRITLYPNITGSIESPYNCTVEVLSDHIGVLEELEEIVCRELVAMGIVSTEAQLIYKKSQEIKYGFPIYTNDYVAELTNQVELVKKNFRNVSLLGKGSGNGFLMNEVLVQTFHEIERISLNTNEGKQHLEN